MDSLFIIIWLFILSYILYQIQKTLKIISYCADKDIKTIFKNQKLFKTELDKVLLNPIIKEGDKIFFLNQKLDYPITTMSKEKVSEIKEFRIIGIKIKEKQK